MKKMIWISTAVVAVGLLTWVVIAHHKSAGLPVPSIAPDPDLAPAAKVVAYLASDRFAKLPSQERLDYLEKVNELTSERRREVFSVQGLSQEQRTKLQENMRNGFRERMDQEMGDFFKLSPEEQVAALDKRIDDESARRAERQQQFQDRARQRVQSGDTGPGQGGPPAGAPGRPSGGFGRGRRAPDPDRMLSRMQERLSDSTPLERAQMREYFRRLHERRQQRAAAASR